jgi:hypothetical protein
MHSRGSLFAVWWGGGGGEVRGVGIVHFWNLVFPNVFKIVLSCSHQVPNGCLLFIMLRV